MLGLVTMKQKIIRTYSELSKLKTFKERFEYLKLDGKVGIDTFGHDRYLNQILYQLPEWKNARDKVIIRDNGCDLGVEGYDIYGRVIVHHMNPITIDDVLNRESHIFNPEYLISTTHNTHNAIHYSDENALPKDPVIRTKNDTCPWKHD